MHPCCCKWQDVILLWLGHTPLFKYTTSSLFLYWWTLRLLPHLGYCSAAVNIGMQILFPISVFIQINIQKWNCCIISSSVFSILRNLHPVFYRGYTLTFSPAVHKSFLFYIFTNTSFSSSWWQPLWQMCSFFVISLWFWFSFLLLVILSSFPCVWRPSVGFSLEKCLFRSPAH